MLILLGASHRSAPLEIRERLAISRADLPGGLVRLTEVDGVEEGLIFSTCNRTEILIRTDQSLDAMRPGLRAFVAGQHAVNERQLEEHTYELTGESAIRHLFRVASGLDSMILGEPQITGQIKRAYDAAREQRATGAILDRLLQHGFSTAKRVRTETAIARNPVSMATAAVSLARKVFGGIEGHRVLVLGTGEIACLLARHLQGQGIGSLFIASRSYSRAVTTSAELGAEPTHWGRIMERVEEVDMVVSCTGAAEQVITREELSPVLRRRRARPLFLIDLAVPRDIDPEIRRLEPVYLYDVDALQGIVDSNLGERQTAAREAGEIVEQEVDSFVRWRRSLSVTPQIVRLRKDVATTVDHEIARFLKQHAPIDSELEQAVRRLVGRVSQKLIHGPIRQLRDAASGGDEESNSEDGPRQVFRGGKER
ncbi:MAG: glutamyl-tRNA reductase [Acidobacteriota bacterium]|nr:glutamyl-tRNA reductase [Acidobacteriota bacterium]MDH3785419.1 glutamyl-tRNA reductase [Acidobacteriota bacterium]